MIQSLFDQLNATMLLSADTEIDESVTILEHIFFSNNI